MTTYYSARPFVYLDGQEDAELGSQLISLLIEETIEGLFRCEVKFSNWGLRDGAMQFLWFDRARLDFGKELSFGLGPPARSRRAFTGRITGLEAEYPATSPPTLTVLLEDALQDLRMTRRTRVFEQSSDADVARQLAGDHGLTPQVDHSGPTYELLVQNNQSDLAFLRERAAAADALLRVESGALHFQARANAEEEVIEMTYGRELRELVTLADLAHQRTAVRVAGWDVGGKQAIAEEAGSSAISSELGSFTGGGPLLEQSFGARVDQVVHLVPFGASEAQELAAVRYRERARRFVTGTAHADGDARVRVGAVVDLSGLGPVFDGRYAVAATRHSFDPQHGHRVTFDVQRAGIGS